MAQISRDRNSSVSGTERGGSGKGVEGLLEQSKNHWEREEEADVCLKVRCANESGGQSRGLPEKMQGCAGAAKQSGGKGFREIAEQ